MRLTKRQIEKLPPAEHLCDLELFCESRKITLKLVRFGDSGRYGAEWGDRGRDPEMPFEEATMWQYINVNNEEFTIFEHIFRSILSAAISKFEPVVERKPYDHREFLSPQDLLYFVGKFHDVEVLAQPQNKRVIELTFWMLEKRSWVGIALAEVARKDAIEFASAALRCIGSEYARSHPTHNQWTFERLDFDEIVISAKITD